MSGRRTAGPHPGGADPLDRTPARFAPASGPLGPRFLYAGLDFIVTRTGQLHLLEVNAHPIGLCAASPLPGRGLADTGCELARAVLTRDPGDHVTLVLPDFFRLAAPSGCAPWLGEVDGPVRPDIRVDRIRQEFNALAGWIRALGGTCEIADVTALSAGAGGEMRCAGRPVTKLYRRAHDLPGDWTRIPCYNDLRLRVLCSDKLATYRMLAETCPAVPQLPLALVDPADDCFQTLLDEAVQAGAWMVVKPRWGSASEGVRRIRASDLQARLRRRGEKCEFPPRAWVAQRWVDPLRMRDSRKEYAVDFRLYVVNGRAVSGVVRRACVPANRFGIDEELAWLTTTGSLLPLDEAWLQGRKAAAVDERLFAQMEQVGVAAVHALEKQCAPLDREEVRRMMPSLQQTLATKGRIRLVRLSPRAA